MFFHVFNCLGPFLIPHVCGMTGHYDLGDLLRDEGSSKKNHRVSFICTALLTLPLGRRIYFQPNMLKICDTIVYSDQYIGPPTRRRRRR